MENRAKKGAAKPTPGPGRFLATDLTLKLGGNNELIVGCGTTGFEDLVGAVCGQNTAVEFTLPVTAKNLDKLKAQLQDVLKNIKA